MPRVTFISLDGMEHTVEGSPDRNLMQVALDQGVPGILGDCGGMCSCATCHGYVDERWSGALPPVSETESFMLEAVPERRASSRLCCQIRLTDALDGIVVRVPAEQV